jgi:hypothetical protein
VVERAGDAPGSSETVFAIESELPGVDSERFQRYYRAFVTADPDSVGRTPVYESLWFRLATQQASGKVRLIHVAMVAESLRERIERDRPDRVRWDDDLPERYAHAVDDVCRSTGVEGDGPRPRTGSRLALYLSILAGLVPFFVDQLLAMLVGLVRDLPDPTDVLVVPSVGRFNSIEPVLEENSFEYEVVISPMWLAWLRSGSLRRRFEGYRPTTFSQFTTPSAIREQVSFLFGDGYRIVVGTRTLEDELVDLLEAETGVRMTESVSDALDREYTAPFFRDLLYRYLAREAIDHLDPEGMVIGSSTPYGKAVMGAATEAGVHPYILPHSMLTATRIEPLYDATCIVAGEYERSWLEEAYYVEDASPFLPLGRPYYDQFADKLEREYQPKTDPLSLLVFTSNINDEIRESYVAAILGAVDSYPGKLSLVIKTHPNEDEAFYRSRFGDDQRVTVTGEGLDRRIREADLAVSMTSNVGLESIIAGTPSVCVDLWEPFVRPQPYQRHDSIRLFTSEDDIAAFFEELDEETLSALFETQRTFVEDGYRLDGRCSERVADYVANERWH